MLFPLAPFSLPSSKIMFPLFDTVFLSGYHLISPFSSKSWSVLYTLTALISAAAALIWSPSNVPSNLHTSTMTIPSLHFAFSYMSLMIIPSIFQVVPHCLLILLSCWYSSGFCSWSFLLHSLSVTCRSSLTLPNTSDSQIYLNTYIQSCISNCSSDISSSGLFSFLLNPFSSFLLYLPYPSQSPGPVIFFSFYLQSHTKCCHFFLLMSL